MTPDALAERMRRLADEVSTELGLRVELASLAAFEKAIAGKPLTDTDLIRWGAFVGEAMIRGGEVAFTWIDFASAAARNTSIAQLGETADTSALLTVGTWFWLPLAKVVKFVANGSQDSLVAFAGTAIAMSRPPAREPREPPRADTLATTKPEGVRRVDGFVQAQTLETLAGINAARTYLLEDELVCLLADRQVTLELFLPFLGDKKLGRAVADFAWRLARAGLANVDHLRSLLAPKLVDKDAIVREHAASAIGIVDHVAGDDAAITSRFHAGDAATRVGSLDAIQSIAYRAHSREDSYDHMHHVSVLIAALSDKSPAARASAHETIYLLAGKMDRNITAFVDALMQAADDGKPAEIEHALQSLTQHLYRVKSGDVPWDPRLEAMIALFCRHTRPVPGKVKMTKVQIAASYALHAVERIVSSTTPERRALIQRALATHATGVPRPA